MRRECAARGESLRVMGDGLPSLSASPSSSFAQSRSQTEEEEQVGEEEEGQVSTTTTPHILLAPLQTFQHDQ
jgi:hypothetical protein